VNPAAGALMSPQASSTPVRNLCASPGPGDRESAADAAFFAATGGGGGYVTNGVGGQAKKGAVEEMSARWTVLSTSLWDSWLGLVASVSSSDVQELQA
jgi:hypothetical protein